MNKKISLGLALSLIAISIAVTFILTSFFSLQSYNHQVVDVNEKGKKYSSLQLLDTQVREKYYGEINEEILNEGIMKGYISGLEDGYSRFLSSDDYEIRKSENSGKTVGLGLTIAPDESGYLLITDILDESPASENGLQIGDIITFVDNTNVKDIGFGASAEAMSGTEGSDISLVVRRDGIDKKYSFTRRAIEISTVTGDMLSGYVGYIKITDFKQNTPEQYVEVLERLTSNGAKSLLFDLRDNNDGLVDIMAECVNPLLPEGVVATAEYKDGHSETLVYSDESELDIPMLVLVNENTAGAAELFALALRDNAKAELVGTKTVGKGVLQQIMELSNGCAIELSVAEIKTPVTGIFNGTGITPDYPVDNTGTNKDAQFNKAVEILQAK